MYRDFVLGIIVSIACRDGKTVLGSYQPFPWIGRYVLVAEMTK